VLTTLFSFFLIRDKALTIISSFPDWYMISICSCLNKLHQRACLLEFSSHFFIMRTNGWQSVYNMAWYGFPKIDEVYKYVTTHILFYIIIYNFRIWYDSIKPVVEQLELEEYLEKDVVQ